MGTRMTRNERMNADFLFSRPSSAKHKGIRAFPLIPRHPRTHPHWHSISILFILIRTNHEHLLTYCKFKFST